MGITFAICLTMVLFDGERGDRDTLYAIVTTADSGGLRRTGCALEIAILRHRYQLEALRKKLLDGAAGSEELASMKDLETRLARIERLRKETADAYLKVLQEDPRYIWEDTSWAYLVAAAIDKVSGSAAPEWALIEPWAKATIDAGRRGDDALAAKQLLAISLCKVQAKDYLNFLVRSSLGEDSKSGPAAELLRWVCPDILSIIEDEKLDTQKKRQLGIDALGYVFWNLDADYKFVFDVTPPPPRGYYTLNWEAFYLRKPIDALGRFSAPLTESEQQRQAGLLDMSERRRSQFILDQLSSL